MPSKNQSNLSPNGCNVVRLCDGTVVEEVDDVLVKAILLHFCNEQNWAIGVDKNVARSKKFKTMPPCCAERWQ